MIGGSVGLSIAEPQQPRADDQETLMAALTVAETTSFPTVANGYDPAVVDAAFGAERAWSNYLEQRAAALLREAEALHAAISARGGVVAPETQPASSRPAVSKRAAKPKAAAAVREKPETAEDLKARQAEEKRRLAAERRKATIAAKKAAEPAAQHSAQAEVKAAPGPVPAQGVAASPGAGWARRTSGATVPRPSAALSKTRPMPISTPAPTALLSPPASASALLAPAGSAGRSESRVIRLG